MLLTPINYFLKTCFITWYKLMIVSGGLKCPLFMSAIALLSYFIKTIHIRVHTAQYVSLCSMLFGSKMRDDKEMFASYFTNKSVAASDRSD